MYGTNLGPQHPKPVVRPWGGEYVAVDFGSFAVVLTSLADHDALIIAAAAAKELRLRQNVITDSERTCPAMNDGWHCHVKGKHDEHEDDNGDQWRTDAACEKCHYPLSKPDHDEMCERRAAYLAAALAAAQGTELAEAAR